MTTLTTKRAKKGPVRPSEKTVLNQVSSADLAEVSGQTRSTKQQRESLSDWEQAS